MHERISVHTICFGSPPFRDLARYWREVGVHHATIFSGQIEQEGMKVAKAALAEGGAAVKCVSHTFFAGQIDGSREKARDAQDRLSRAIDIATELGASSIYIVTGGHGSLTWEEAAEHFSNAIAPGVREAKTAGISLTIECAAPVYAHFHMTHTLRDTVTLAEMAGIGVCIDIYACWTEAGLKESVERAIPRCGLIQVGDYVYGDTALPGRAVVGDGAVPVKRICGWALDAGYKGMFDLEILGPRIDKEGYAAAVTRSTDNLGSILQSLGA